MSPHIGRPKADNPKDIRFSIRLDSETFARLQQRCERDSRCTSNSTGNQSVFGAKVKIPRTVASWRTRSTRDSNPRGKPSGKYIIPFGCTSYK